jgi:adenylate cyclase
VIVGDGTAQRARRHPLLRLGERILRGKEKPTILYTFDSGDMALTDNHSSTRKAAETHL